MKKEKLPKHLEKVSKLLISVLFLLSNYASAFAINLDDDSVARAIGVIKDVYSDYPKEHAIVVLQNAAIKDSLSSAMNALGVVYLYGIAVEKDSSKALYWFEQAGKNAYPDAYHNIGAIYKEGSCGFQQDFVKAFEAFEKGAEKESAICKYDKGFMLYKGLGCRQDYIKAIDLFTSAANEGHPRAMYMLGLCYRNGYGVEQDEQKGLTLLNMAAKLGDKDASYELSQENPENKMESGNSMDFLQIEPVINDSVNDLSVLSGKFEGTLAMFDWSGEYLLTESNASMIINRNGNCATGFFVLGFDTIPYSSDILQNCEMQFKDCYFNMYDRYSYGEQTKYRFENAKFDIWNDEIKGKLSTYSISQSEPGRPIYFKLHRSGNQENIKNMAFSDSIYVMPNPFKYQFEIRFNLFASSNVKAVIYDKYGVKVWQQNLGFLEKGNQNVLLTPNINSGYYVLKLNMGTNIFSTIIIKSE